MSGDNVINEFSICVIISARGVERGLRYPPPGCSAARSVPEASHSNFTSGSCSVFVPPVRIDVSSLAASSFFMGALTSFGSVRMYMSRPYWRGDVWSPVDVHISLLLRFIVRVST